MVSIIISGCRTSPETNPTKHVIRPVLTETVTDRKNNQPAFNGVVRAAKRADLAFRVGGHITDIYVDEGDHVKSGQLIAKLDSRDLESALNSAAIEMENATIEYERAKAIYENSRAISESALDTVMTRFNLIKTRYEEAKRQVEYAQLRAPFDGIVGLKMVDIHTEIQANSPVAILHDLNDLEVIVNIPHSVMLSSHRGTKAFAQLSALSGYRFPLTLRSYATQADPISQTYAVALGFDDLKGMRILPGMAVKVFPHSPELSSETSDEQLISIPLTAVVPNNQGQQYVWVIDDNNTVQKRYVAVGHLKKDRVVIKDNLKQGERIAIAGVSSLSNGQEVRPYSNENAGGQ